MAKHQLAILKSELAEPRPGCLEAIKQGCKCIQLFNRYGHSAALFGGESGKDVYLLFVIDDECQFEEHRKAWERFQGLFG